MKTKSNKPANVTAISAPEKTFGQVYQSALSTIGRVEKSHRDSGNVTKSTANAITMKDGALRTADEKAAFKLRDAVALLAAAKGCTPAQLVAIVDAGEVASKVEKVA